MHKIFSFQCLSINNKIYIYIHILRKTIKQKMLLPKVIQVLHVLVQLVSYCKYTEKRYVKFSVFKKYISKRITKHRVHLSNIDVPIALLVQQQHHVVWLWHEFLYNKNKQQQQQHNNNKVNKTKTNKYTQQEQLLPIKHTSTLRFGGSRHIFTVRNIFGNQFFIF